MNALSLAQREYLNKLPRQCHRQRHPRLLVLVVGYIKEIVDEYHNQKKENNNNTIVTTINPLMELPTPIDVCNVIKQFYQLTISVFGRGLDAGQFGRGAEYLKGVNGLWEDLTEFTYLSSMSALLSSAQDVYPSGWRMTFIYNQQQQQIYASGHNYNGKCGVGDVHEDQILEFTPIMALPMSPNYCESSADGNDNNNKNLMVTNISNGVSARHAIIRLRNGAFFGWGDNVYKELGMGNDNEHVYRDTFYHSPTYLREVSERVFRDLLITQIECGMFHSVFLTGNGQAFACGNNAYYQCGITNASGNIIPLPTRIGGVLEGVRVKQIAVGSCYTLCLAADAAGNHNNVIAFGGNEYTQLGFECDCDDANKKRAKPKRISYFDHLDAQCVRAAYDKSSVILADGKCFMFGENKFTELFTVKPSPSKKCPIHHIQQTLREYGDFSKFGDNNDGDEYRSLSLSERLRLQWIFQRTSGYESGRCGIWQQPCDYHCEYQS